jgi:hypothetical protein
MNVHVRVCVHFIILQRSSKLYEPPFSLVWLLALLLVTPVILLNSLSIAIGGNQDQDHYQVSRAFTTSYDGTYYYYI